jgi:hypothetical protein
MSGMDLAVLAGAIVVLAGALFALVTLPAKQTAGRRRERR